MKLLVLGATGGIGRAIVAQALARGDDVTALVRTPQKITVTHDRLRVIGGNPLERSEIAPLLADRDAVLSTLGHTSLGPSTLVADGIRALVPAMMEHRVARLCIVSTTLVLPGGGALTRIPKWITRHAVADSVAAERLVRESSLNWTILRLVRLTNGELEPFETFDGAASVFEHLTRASAAACMLDLARDGGHARKAIGARAVKRAA